MMKELAWKHSKDPADPSEIAGNIWVFTEKELQAFCEEYKAELIRTIDVAYWQIESGDRIGALKTLAPYAIQRSINSSQEP
jgi:hypothetical protein